MPGQIEIGQSWSTWVSGRQQWLLATVVRRESGQATLKYDIRYGIARGHDEQKVDENTMLTTSNLFRFIEPKS